jgi:hypothetical protein
MELWQVLLHSMWPNSPWPAAFYAVRLRDTARTTASCCCEGLRAKLACFIPRPLGPAAHRLVGASVAAPAILHARPLHLVHRTT